MPTDTAAITNKLNEFAQALRAGKLEWTTTELVPFIVDAAGSEKTATGRAALCARIIAGALGVSYDDSRQGRYVFSSPSGKTNGTLPEVVVKVVEKIVEKVVYKEKETSPENRESQLVYPAVPAKQAPLEGYVVPAWYKRMESALNAGKHVAIAGPPGGGKSTGPEQYFIRKGQPFVVVNGDSGLRRRDLEGTPSIDKNGSWFQVAEFAAAAVNGWGVILNEVNAADPDALLWLNGIIETPHRINIGGRSFPVHKDFKLVVTYNPGLVGTKALPQAFKDRFFPVKLGFPPKAFLKKLMVVKGMDENAAYADRLLKYAADCWALHEKGNLRYQITPRRLFDVAFLLDSGTCTDLNDAIKQAIVDAVDSPADAQMLIKLVTQPLAEVGPVSQYGGGAA